MRILLTGAAGMIGTALRPALRARYAHVRLLDVRAIPDVEEREEAVVADISDLSQVTAASTGIDCVLHFAGIPREAAWEEILSANIVGTYNAFEAARLAGVRRVVFASSNHVIGFHRSERPIGLDAETRPDSRYGVSKVFGEGIARLYSDKHGLEAVCLRFGSVRTAPEDRRQLATWMSLPDAVALVTSAIETPIRYAVAYGVSANRRNLWSNEGTGLTGFAPRDDAEAFAGAILGQARPADPVSAAFHGGPFCAEEFDGDLDRID